MSSSNLIAKLSYMTTVGGVTPFHPDSVPSVVMFPFIEPPWILMSWLQIGFPPNLITWRLPVKQM